MTINRIFQTSQVGLIQAREALERSADRISRWGFTAQDGTMKHADKAASSEDVETLSTEREDGAEDIDLLEEVVHQNRAATSFRANAAVMRLAQEAYQSMDRVGRRH